MSFQQTLPLALLVLLAAPALAQQASPLSIAECTVISQRDPARKTDCRATAAAACKDPKLCELVIGLQLTGGTDLHPGERKDVRVRYTCGERVSMKVGPYDQSDHASMTLACPG